MIQSGRGSSKINLIFPATLRIFGPIDVLPNVQIFRFPVVELLTKNIRPVEPLEKQSRGTL